MLKMLAVAWPIMPAQAHCKGNHSGYAPHCGNEAPDPKDATYDLTSTLGEDFWVQ